MGRTLPLLVLLSALLGGCSEPEPAPATVSGSSPGGRYAGANYPDKPASENPEGGNVTPQVGR